MDQQTIEKTEEQLLFNHQRYPYASQRSAMYSTRGMVATSQPLAAQAGLDMLKKAAMRLMLRLQQLPV